jgi:hypothetical protein
MRSTKLFPAIVAALAFAVALPGCSKEAEKPEVTAENIQEVEPLVEQHEAATVAWNVEPDGKVRALVKSPDGKPVDKNVTGTLTVKPVAKNPVPTTVPLTLDAKTGLMTAVVPPLEYDLTEVKYDLNVNEKPVKGALHLPPGGTKDLVLNAKASVEVKLPEGKKGPNGGVIQVVGKDTIEIVGDKGSGTTRVYFLDADLKPVKVVPEKTVKIAVVTKDGPETIILTPDPGGLYFQGKFGVVVNPTKITVAVSTPEVTNVVLCGWSPGKVIVVGPAAPVVGVFVAVNWGIGVVKPVVVVHDDDDDDHVVYVGKGKGKGKWHGKHGRGGKVHIKIH